MKIEKKRRKKQGLLLYHLFNSSLIWSMCLELDRHVSTSVRFPCLRNRVFSPRPRNTQITEARSNACVQESQQEKTGRSLCIVIFLLVVVALTKEEFPETGSQKVLGGSNASDSQAVHSLPRIYDPSSREDSFPPTRGSGIINSRESLGSSEIY